MRSTTIYDRGDVVLVRTMARSTVERRLGTISRRDMNALEENLKLSLELP